MVASSSQGWAVFGVQSGTSPFSIRFPLVPFFSIVLIGSGINTALYTHLHLALRTNSPSTAAPRVSLNISLLLLHVVFFVFCFSFFSFYGILIEVMYGLAAVLKYSYRHMVPSPPHGWYVQNQRGRQSDSRRKGKRGRSDLELERRI